MSGKPRREVKHYISGSTDPDRMYGGLHQNSYVRIREVVLFAWRFY